MVATPILGHVATMSGRSDQADQAAQAARAAQKKRQLLRQPVEAADNLFRQKKETLRQQIVTIRAAYQNTYDKHTTVMLMASVTVIIPACYYIVKGLILDALPRNRANQCTQLLDILHMTGTQYGADASGNLRKKMLALFKTLNAGKSQKTIDLLLKTYALVCKVHPDFIMPLIEDYYHQKAQQGILANSNFNVDMVNTVLEYTPLRTHY